MQNDGDEEAEVEERGREDEKWWTRRARSLVKGHTSSERRKPGVPRSKSLKQWTSLERPRDLNDRQLNERQSSNHDHDLESTGGADATRYISRLPRGQGVLSTLLALYNAGSGGSVSSSVVTSHATTPDDSDREDNILRDENEEDQHQRQRGPPTSYFDSHAPTASTISPLPNTPVSAPSNTFLPHKQTNKFHIPLPSTSRTASSLHLPTVHGGRPKAAQNAGGVFGSLIATSGNLTGPAAPVPSTIGPDVKRKGFGLSRSDPSSF
jgi:hypothetical protein